VTDLSDITAEDLRRYLRAEGWEAVDTYGLGDVWRHPSGKPPCAVTVPFHADDYEDRMQIDNAIAAVAQIERRPSVAEQLIADVRRLRDEAQAPPEPAADVRTVTRCEDCPASYVTLDPLCGPERWCGLDDARAPSEGIPPDWCPLRRGPVTLRLEVNGGGQP
tara:strand:+ start:261148 stop:261636 length:489 start_codon:yes stop_codon:yes gene_type:complete